MILPVSDFARPFKPVKSLNTIPPIDQHVVLVQSAYHDEQLSRDRLDITKHTAIPSLMAQTARPSVNVSVFAADPLLDERKAAWEQTGLDVRFTLRDVPETPIRLATAEIGDNWDLPEGPRLAVTRMDDDDGIPVDYIAITQKSILECKLNHAVFTWPLGYSSYRGRLWKANTKRIPNQFATIVSNDAYHPHMMPEYMLGRFFHIVVPCRSRGWIWIRHPHGLAKMHWNYNRGVASPPNLSRWAIQLPPGKKR